MPRRKSTSTVAEKDYNEVTWRGGVPKRDPWKPCGLPPFPDVPKRIRNILVRAGLRSIQEVRGLPDEDLFHMSGLAYASMKALRQFYPWTGEYPELMVCPCCGGLGKVRRFQKKTFPYKTRHFAEIHAERLAQKGGDDTHEDTESDLAPDPDRQAGAG